MKRFAEKRVVITGAGSGLGRALSLDFAAMGWKVAVSDLDPARIDETVAAVNRAGGQGLGVRCDVSRADEVEHLKEAVFAQWGGVDILINNAGVYAVGQADKVPLEDWRWIMEINLMGVVHGCRTFLPLFKQQGGGHIVNVASAAGIVSLAEMAPYNVTKAGVISLTETLRMELAGLNVGVTVATPTFFKTNLMDQGRHTDEHLHRRTVALFDRSMCDADHVSQCILRAISKNRLYVLPQLDGRLCWLFKRLAPQLFYGFLGLLRRKGWLDAFLRI